MFFFKKYPLDIMTGKPNQPKRASSEMLEHLGLHVKTARRLVVYYYEMYDVCLWVTVNSR
jgi:hypothetical protein